jgi:hypothetical protein
MSRAPMRYDSVYPTFRPTVLDRRQLGPRLPTRFSCGDARFVNAIRSTATDADAKLSGVLRRMLPAHLKGEVMVRASEQ